MSGTLKITVGGSVQADADAFVDAWNRAERGEAVSDHTITFESWEALSNVLTTKRLELLRHLHANPSASIAALARAVGRDYKRVHQDVEILVDAGLIDRGGDGLRAPYDAIETTIAIAG